MSGTAARPTLFDVCIVLALLMLLGGGFLPAVSGRTRETAHRVKCASNLRQIGQAMQIYAATNKGSLPRTTYDGAGGSPTYYTGVHAADPFGTGGPNPNDVTAAAFLLVRTTDLGSEAFTCPTALFKTPWDLDGKKPGDVSNFPGRESISYSFTNPYPTRAATAAGFTYDHTLTSDFALAADINPGPPSVLEVVPTSKRQEMLRANSANHNGDGQNVLYADGHVEFQNTPFCGMLRDAGRPAKAFRDNIYTFGNGHRTVGTIGVTGAPVDELDSVLLPPAPEGWAPAGPNNAKSMVIGAGAVVAVAFVALALMLLRLRRSSPAPT